VLARTFGSARFVYNWGLRLRTDAYYQRQERIGYAATSAALAANQGLYNSFLAAGIVAGLAASDPGAGFALIAFSLSCVIVAGIFGAFTVSWRTLLLQTVPGAVALGALVFLR